jgi:SAM-dependent methyltransferase
MNAEDEILVDEYLTSGGFMTLLEEDEDGNFIEVVNDNVRGTNDNNIVKAVATQPEKLPKEFICPFVPTSKGRINGLLKKCKPEITVNDVVLDLGSGDGRVIIEIVKETSCYGIGCEIDPKLHEYSRKQTAIYEGTNNPLNNIKWICDDIRKISFQNVTIVVLYLIPSAINQLNKFLLTNFLNNNFRLYSFVYKIPWEDVDEIGDIINIDPEYNIYEYKKMNKRAVKTE